MLAPRNPWKFRFHKSVHLVSWTVSVSCLRGVCVVFLGDVIGKPDFGSIGSNIGVRVILAGTVFLFSSVQLWFHNFVQGKVSLLSLGARRMGFRNFKRASRSMRLRLCWGFFWRLLGSLFWVVFHVAV